MVADKVELSDEVPATDNQIGADVGAAGAQTAACDLGCNVFASKSSATAAIDLQGVEIEEEKPATGPTQIEGNYIGLDATGEPLAEDATNGVRVGSAAAIDGRAARNQRRKLPSSPASGTALSRTATTRRRGQPHRDGRPRRTVRTVDRHLRLLPTSAPKRRRRAVGDSISSTNVAIEALRHRRDRRQRDRRRRNRDPHAGLDRRDREPDRRQRDRRPGNEGS